MKNIKVLGTGCANCRNTLKRIDEVARARGIAIQRRRPVLSLSQGLPLG